MVNNLQLKYKSEPKLANIRNNNNHKIELKIKKWKTVKKTKFCCHWEFTIGTREIMSMGLNSLWDCMSQPSQFIVSGRWVYLNISVGLSRLTNKIKEKKLDLGNYAECNSARCLLKLPTWEPKRYSPGSERIGESIYIYWKKCFK